MIRHEFREEKSSLGKVLRPVAEVVLEKDDFSVGIPMYIDSGADISMIPLRFGRALGFKQEEKDTIQVKRKFRLRVTMLEAQSCFCQGFYYYRLQMTSEELWIDDL